MGTKTYADKNSFVESITDQIGSRVFQKIGSKICLAANDGRKKFVDKLGWLEEFQPELITYTQMVDLALNVEAQVKNFGLTSDSKCLFERMFESQELSPRSQIFKQKVIDYLAQESAKVPDGKTLLATSDVVESLFGKYKLFNQTNCLRELGKRILTIPLCTLSITGELIKNAMATISERDVENWANSVFGQSAISKRREAFSSPKKDTKVA